MEWHCAVGCSAHDAHNALRWAHASVFNDTSLLEDVYVGVLALQQSFYNAVDVLGTWLLQVLAPMTADSLPSSSELYVLWCAMNVDEALAQSIADMGLLWREGRLLIDESILVQDDWLETLSAYLLALWRFTKFTHSRWVTVGTSCRGLCRALLTGYMDLVRFMRDRGTIREYTWHGCQNLELRALRCVVALSLAAYIPEEFLRSVLADSRVARTQEELAGTLQNEFHFLDFLPAGTWQLLASSVSMAAHDLRDAAVAGALISWSFLDFRVLREARELPWSLC